MDPGMLIVGIAVAALIGGICGSGRKIGGGGGAFIGALLGPIGWIIALASPAAEPEAPPTTILDRVERRPAAPGWHQDPLGRFDSRWYDGQRWTQHVGRVGADGSHQQFEDPV